MTDTAEIFRTPNTPEHAKHLPWAYHCGADGCSWRTYHRSQSAAESERSRHHRYYTCPYEGRRMGNSIIETLWQELDVITKFIITNKQHIEDDGFDRDGYHKMIGKAHGLSTAIVIMSTPHFEDVTAVAKWSRKRLYMAEGSIDWEPTPGIQGHNPMPAPNRELTSQSKAPKRERSKVGITGVKSSSPKDNPRYGTFRAVTDEEKQRIWEMYGRFPDETIMKMMKVSKEQLAGIIAQHEQKKDEVYKK